MSVLSTSSSALSAFQQALQTTSHNIANVYTEGYNRQQVNFNARASQTDNPANPGQGVILDRVFRAYDENVVANLRETTSAHAHSETLSDMAKEIDTFFANSETGLSTQVQNFFGTLHDISNDPTSVPVRQVLLGNADILTSRFKDVDNRLSEIEGNVNARLSNGIAEINSFSEQIAEVNSKILDTGGGNSAPNQLLDLRDHLINQLSEKINVSTVNQQDGTMSVFIGNGQNLVLGSTAQKLALANSRYPGDSMRVEYAKSSTDITELLSGGEVGAVLDFNKDLLRPTQNDIGRLAATVSTSFNYYHNQGYGLDDTMTYRLEADEKISDLAVSVGSYVEAESANQDKASLSATFLASFPDTSNEASQRGITEKTTYEITLSGADYVITKMDENGDPATDNNNVPVAITVPATPGTINADDGVNDLGFNFTVTSGTVADGDTFTVYPFQAPPVERDFFTINDPQVRSNTGNNDKSVAVTVSIYSDYSLLQLDAFNALSAGVADINRDRLTDSSDVAFMNMGAGLRASDYELSRDSSTATGWSITRLSDNSNITIIQPDPAVETFVTADGFSFSAPPPPADPTTVDGDSFLIRPFETSAQSIESSITDPRDIAASAGAGVGDNQNMNALIGLQTERFVEGNYSLNQVYGQLVADVGTATAGALAAFSVQEVMLDQAQSERDKVSGVNLDEEAANIMKYQQAYQAAARVMQISDDMFQTLISSF